MGSESEDELASDSNGMHGGALTGRVRVSSAQLRLCPGFEALGYSVEGWFHLALSSRAMSAHKETKNITGS